MSVQHKKKAWTYFRQYNEDENYKKKGKVEKRFTKLPLNLIEVMLMEIVMQ